MALHRFKMLADQVTHQVIWLSYYMDNQPPNFETNLDYHLFNGETNLNVWKLYCSYQLFYDKQSKVLFSAAPILTDNIRFSRAKAMAINWINSAIDFQYEKYNYGQKDMFYSMSNNKNQWIHTFQLVHNCTDSEALKLLNFKLEEYNLAIFQLESFRYSFNNKIKLANTLEDIDQYYEEATAQLINSNRIKLSETPIIMGLPPESDVNQA